MDISESLFQLRKVHVNIGPKWRLDRQNFTLNDIVIYKYCARGSLVLLKIISERLLVFIITWFLFEEEILLFSPLQNSLAKKMYT